MRPLWAVRNMISDWHLRHVLENGAAFVQLQQSFSISVSEWGAWYNAGGHFFFFFFLPYFFFKCMNLFHPGEGNSRSFQFSIIRGSKWLCLVLHLGLVLHGWPYQGWLVIIVIWWGHWLDLMSSYSVSFTSGPQLPGHVALCDRGSFSTRPHRKNK